MMQDADSSLERQLSALTEWSGGHTSLWRGALASARPKPRRLMAWLRRPLGSAVAASILILLPVGLLVAFNLPHLGVKRDRARVSTNLRGIGQGMYIYAQDDPGMFPHVAAIDFWDRVRRSNVTPRQLLSPSTTKSPTADSYAYQLSSSDSEIGTSSSPRLVVSKATMELVTPDVRGAFHKAMHVIQEAAGEYIQGSNLWGAEENLYAQLTLRVDSNRLGDVLNALRQLGNVRTEQTEGQDVTAQVIDLDAQLRNERRVETEMLELLEKRNDSSLTDIMALREKLREVRREIERLTAQKEQLSRLVSLASVLVLISSSDAPVEAQGIAQYFKRTWSSAWRDGLTFLADTLGVVVATAVGGLLLWPLAIAVGATVWKWRRNRIRRDAEGSSGNPPLAP